MITRTVWVDDMSIKMSEGMHLEIEGDSIRITTIPKSVIEVPPSVIIKTEEIPLAPRLAEPVKEEPKVVPPIKKIPIYTEMTSTLAAGLCGFMVRLIHANPDISRSELSALALAENKFNPGSVYQYLHNVCSKTGIYNKYVVPVGYREEVISPPKTNSTTDSKRAIGVITPQVHRGPINTPSVIPQMLAEIQAKVAREFHANPPVLIEKATIQSDGLTGERLQINGKNNKKIVPHGYLSEYFGRFLTTQPVLAPVKKCIEKFCAEYDVTHSSVHSNSDNRKGKNMRWTCRAWLYKLFKNHPDRSKDWYQKRFVEAGGVAKSFNNISWQTQQENFIPGILAEIAEHEKYDPPTSIEVALNNARSAS